MGISFLQNYCIDTVKVTVQYLWTVGLFKLDFGIPKPIEWWGSHYTSVWCNVFDQVLHKSVSLTIYQQLQSVVFRIYLWKATVCIIDSFVCSPLLHSGSAISYHLAIQPLNYDYPGQRKTIQSKGQSPSSTTLSRPLNTSFNIFLRGSNH